MRDFSHNYGAVDKISTDITLSVIAQLDNDTYKQSHQILLID